MSWYTKEEIEKQGLTLFGVVPQDQEVYEYDCDGKPMTELPDDAAVKTALYKILYKAQPLAGSREGIYFKTPYPMGADRI